MDNPFTPFNEVDSKMEFHVWVTELAQKGYDMDEILVTFIEVFKRFKWEDLLKELPLRHDGCKCYEVYDQKWTSWFAKAQILTCERRPNIDFTYYQIEKVLNAKFMSLDENEKCRLVKRIQECLTYCVCYDHMCECKAQCFKGCPCQCSRERCTQSPILWNETRYDTD